MSMHSLVVFVRRLSCITLVLIVPAPLAAAEGRTGEQIYQQRCASCHGVKGEGTTDSYPKPLVGDRSTAQLAKLIAKSMPKDADEKCTGPDADKVAAYIYDTF